MEHRTKFCEECFIARLELHPEAPEKYLKCPVCGFTCLIKTRPAPFGNYEIPEMDEDEEF
jgi:DNA-directed RNA polymerase subunit RPC12/RpoP